MDILLCYANFNTILKQSQKNLLLINSIDSTKLHIEIISSLLILIFLFFFFTVDIKVTSSIPNTKSFKTVVIDLKSVSKYSLVNFILLSKIIVSTSYI